MSAAFVRALALLAMAGAVLAARAGEPADATVAGVFGTRGVTHTSQTATRHGMTYSDLTYRDATGGLVTVRLGDPAQFALWKQVAAGHLAPVDGVGLEAFRLETFRSICARSATTAVCVTPDPLRSGPKPSDAQLMAVARAAL